MQELAVILLATGLFPLIRAWWTHQRTSLLQAIHWAIMAWLAWFLFQVTTLFGGLVDNHSLRYLALCLTGCAGVAVLGARRPHVGAWNFVVLGLLAVLLLPLVENAFVGVRSLDLLRVVFLSATLAVGWLNYLPTRFAPAVLLLALVSGLDLFLLVQPDFFDSEKGLHELARGLVPWIAWWCWSRQTEPANELDRLWRDFRNCWGLVWGQRLREQFNRAAANAGWPVFLSWQGLRRLASPTALDPAMAKEMLDTFQALLKRFGPEE